MTPDEALAQYIIERDGILNELHPYAGKYPGTSIAWHKERDRLALDAAVRDCMEAMAEFVHAFEDDRPPDERICVADACGACAAIDELDRLLPDTRQEAAGGEKKSDDTMDTC